MNRIILTLATLFLFSVSNAQVDANCAINISGKVINTQTSEYLDKVSVKLFGIGEDEPIIELKTAEDATYSLPLNCATRYIIEVSKENFTIVRKAIYTSRDATPLELDFKLFQIKEFITKDTNKLIDVGHVSFETDNSKLSKETIEKLDQVVIVMKKYETIRVSVDVHTDSQSESDYSLKISNDRAAAVVSYISEKGIDPERLEAFGYGDKNLINHCAKGVECTENQHKENRRIEFVVIP